MIVIDASALAPALSDQGPDGELVRRRIEGETLAAPELIDLEVASILRRGARAGRLNDALCREALFDLARMPLQRASHLPLLSRIWELRDNLTAYDAAYVALAEAIGASVLTADGKLKRASGMRCQIELLET